MRKGGNDRKRRRGLDWDEKDRQAKGNQEVERGGVDCISDVCQIHLQNLMS
jgi:hypothetical protein